MNVNVKCYATLAETDTCHHNVGVEHEMETGASVKRLVERLGLPGEKVEIVFVNGRKTDMNATLSEGDRVGLFPAVGGM